MRRAGRLALSLMLAVPLAAGTAPAQDVFVDVGACPGEGWTMATDDFDAASD